MKAHNGKHKWLSLIKSWSISMILIFKLLTGHSCKQITRFANDWFIYVCYVFVYGLFIVKISNTNRYFYIVCKNQMANIACLQCRTLRNDCRVIISLSFSSQTEITAKQTRKASFELGYKGYWDIKLMNSHDDDSATLRFLSHTDCANIQGHCHQT